ncbi:MAG TPA: lipopolysaccharide biosynthesis protein [Burkholderiales bacterium]|nr:lipopolysaccharide biosynthesis protein [Burkholderiales bacterium]
MDIRRLLVSTALYGIADVLVMAVGGFLLLPLYTRTLAQGEFGMYVAIRSNVEILTYLLYFGLPSAVARVYFDHRQLQRQGEYLSSIVNFFVIVLAGSCGVLWLWGPSLWNALSPTTPAHPYLPYAVALAAVSFPAAIASLWLRMESRPLAMVAMQLGASAVLAALAAFNLLVLDAGLPGLLVALLASAAVPAAALAWLFGRSYRPVIRRAHVTESLRYALPILLGYISYFVLNRLSTLILQRHVPIEDLAVYGLAQQLSMIVALAGTSFGMALQPAVFGAQPADALDIIQRTGRVLLVLMFGVTSALMLFADDLFAFVAPSSYGDGHTVLLLLVVANFTNAFTLMSDTALLYHRRPKTSVAISMVGAVASAALGFWLIPRYQLHGAALSVVGAFVIRMLISHWMAWRVTGYAYVGPMLGAMAAVSALAWATGWIGFAALPEIAPAGVKAGLGALILLTTYYLYRRLHSTPCVK